ncbi:peptidyl-prolyl cis-trans isomerase [Hydrocarboniphaga sp.]|uniref:peptidyl-prolyl cis-trans isomerase n=1 Tax=Hydrocarboniphaga sp. TaxID=2033016 RepID=UPI003D0A87BF
MNSPATRPGEASADSNTFFDFSRADSRRSFTLLAIGAVLGLGIAGYGLFTAKGTSTRGLPPEDIALVNQKPIYRSDFIIQVQTQFSIPFDQTTPEQRARVLKDMVDEELMVQRGVEVDLPGYDPDVRTALVNGVELQMFADVLAKQPTEEELKAYYAQHREQYSSVGVMQLRDLILNFKDAETSDQKLQRASAIVDKLRKGAVPDDAFLNANGLQDSRRLMQGNQIDVGDIFDFAAAANLDPKVYAAAEKLGAGEVSDPVSDAEGLHIVYMKHRRKAQGLDFDAVRLRVWSDIKTEAEQKTRNATLGYLRSKADIITAGDY